MLERSELDLDRADTSLQRLGDSLSDTRDAHVVAEAAERLQAEHVVVHELLERQIEALNVLVTAPSAEHFAGAVEVYEALERILASHLGYEEEQIGDALGYYGLV